MLILKLFLVCVGFKLRAENETEAPPLTDIHCLTCLTIINPTRFTCCAHSGSWSSPCIRWNNKILRGYKVSQTYNLLKHFPLKFTHFHNDLSRKLPLFVSGRTLCSNKNRHTREDERTNQYRFPTAIV